MGCEGKRARFWRKRQNGLELKISFTWGTGKKKDPNIISGAALCSENRGIVWKERGENTVIADLKTLPLGCSQSFLEVFCSQLHPWPCRLEWISLLRCRCERDPHRSRESGTDCEFTAEREKEKGGGSQHGARAKVSTDAVDFLVPS